MTPALFLRKIKTVFVHPKSSFWKACHLFGQWRGRRNLEASGLKPILARVERAHREVGAFAPVYSELFNLYRLVRERKPKIMFEFGSGCSTFVLAKAFQDNARDSPGSGGKLYSMEADAAWCAHTRNTLTDDLSPFCEVIHSPVVVEKFQGQNVFRHQQVPDEIPDIVYLDGPALRPDCKVAADLIWIEDQLPVGFLLVIDGRKPNTDFLRQHLRREYDYWEDLGLFGNVHCQRFLALRG